ncbi:hypothetical protein CLAFUW4_03745 [Fulvia fulva]|uniref:ADF-H domain-containing protein n=1 Tax=Passalora fulva TaxID=5499 RepID=A0A9Q8P513_PASFU|nr:uncharacterized protein CLAFUR5_03720 [Fulvia fulva]KAK4631929.1 hypothetical protein CLAFUR4_03733 [Fulvia fulva]UJO13528.1 hypothetical protein CLAFUR5_03720 [Fulvia fulva]WPV11013.1 hypothetical protein CLAFUW4_03745 [Fulvia fulva]WPV26354.1 hypothetical protein CLAFUW7_03737 [Fulvia fulva]
MSLNGLDTPEVQDAYQSAIAEAGGWFLLKYTSRDSIELLGRGKSGVSEARNAILGYSEASPLYGLIIYRRRRILIKCIPDGTSRLLQARTAVHLQDILERYSPYETLLEITNGEGLNDTALAASFQLRTASASPSPSPSTKRLDEISEDAEDNGEGADGQARAETSSNSLSAPPRPKMDRRAEHMKKFGKRTSSLGVGKSPQLLGQQRAASPASPLKQSMSQYLVHEEAGHTSITPLETPLPEVSLPVESDDTEAVKQDSAQHSKEVQDISDSASQRTATDASDATEVPVSPKPSSKQPSSAAEMRDRDLPALPAEGSASSTQKSSRTGRSASMSERTVSTHSLADDPYGFSKFDELFKPKVKLAPRPVHSPEKIQSPAVARTSALPASFRPANRKQETLRPKSSGNGLAVPARPTPPAPTAYITPPPPPVPETPDYSARPTTRGSVRSAPSHKSHGMTPDKIRLMKAVELRRRQLRKSQEPPSRPTFDDDAPAIPKVPDVSDSIPTRTIKIIRTPEAASEQEAATDEEEQPQSSKADSGIEMHYRKQDKASGDRDLQSTPSASKPSTPEPGTIPTSQSTGTPVPPPIIQESPKEIDNASEETNSQLQPDDAASIESKTPTERSEFFVQEPASTEELPVPTIIMADGSRPMTSDEPILQPAVEADGEGSTVEDSGTEVPEESPSSPRRQNSDLAKRRRGYVEPLQTDLNSGNPDDFTSDDDDLLDELHSAIIVEATPVTVARSPLTPTLPGRRPSADTLASVRSVNITRMGSSPTDKGSDERLAPDLSRMVVPRTLTPPGEKRDSTSGLSRNVSSEISKRIQALSLQSRPLTPEVSPNGFAPRPTRSGPTSYRRHSSNRAAHSPARSGAPENAPVWSVQRDPATNRNSVSVTARIVRPNVISESVAEDSREALQQSEYVVNNERDAGRPGNRPASIRTAKTQSETSTPALSPVLSRSSTEARTMHSAGNSRFGRHKHQNSSIPVSTPGLDEFPPPPGTRTGGSTPSIRSNDENAAPKEGSKASRFMKRMSILPFGGSNKRKSGAQQQSSAASLFEYETIGAAAPTPGTTGTNSRVSSVHEKSDTPPAVVVGDLNVQFPDSLLWKRRIVTIDDSGYLQFAIAQAMEIHKGVALKKFALNDFKLPYVPDLDMQELSYSIMLEFHDGTTLQTACEDAMTQRQVLHILKTYWKAWA